jgi:hypothetical protein
MSLTPGVVHDSQINATITQIYQRMRDVRLIRFDRRTDWSGDDAIYFRILISDDAARTRLRETMAEAANMLESSLSLTTLGYYVYYNVRSISEQAALREKSWENVLS